MKLGVGRVLKIVCIGVVFSFGLLIQPSLRSGAQESQSLGRQVQKLFEQKCTQCHGEAVQMGGLDLRTQQAILRGGESGPAVSPGKGEQSLLYRRIAGLKKPLMPMAPMPPLSAAEIALIRTWIDRGAEIDAGTRAANPLAAPSTVAGYKEREITPDDRNWWSFKPPVRASVPAIADARWNRNPIDAWIKRSLDQKGLVPAARADRNTLIRRAYLDLIGLPPSPAEVDAFLADRTPQAFEKLIERLLSSPQYGERWGRFWMDVVRYADSSGYEHDFDNANAWRYRDYVIKAFNQDKPFNRFILEQLAGDELEDRDQDSLIATTFYRIGPRVRYREKDNPYYRYEYLDDTIRTTFQGFMGLSVNCARCHDHKFDPVTRLDYYRSMAMFFGQVEYNHPLAAPEKVAEYQRRKKAVDDQIRPLMAKVIQIEAPYRRAAFEKRLAKFPEEIQAAVRTPEAQRTPGQRLLASQILSIDVDPDAAAAQNVAALYSRNRIKISDEDNQLRETLLDQVETHLKKTPAPLPVADGVRDGDYRLAPDGAGDEPLPGKGGRFEYGVECCYLPEAGKPYSPPPVYFAANGQNVSDDQKSFVVEPGFLSVLNRASEQADIERPESVNSSGRRLALARWIGSADNPLTSRVIVNRLWQWHFGRGLVATPGNFGRMGLKPTHLELLDWLATEFVRQGWSIKQMHRLIMNTEVYQMASSGSSAGNVELDPANLMLWRFPLRRLEAEAIRDSILLASGQLNPEAGGPPFFPAIPKSVRQSYLQGKWVMTEEGPATWRRSVYAYWKRGLKYPMFEVHDQPDPNVTCEMRNVTTVPTQALTLLNNEFVLIQARFFAQRVLREAGDDPAAQIRAFYRIAYSRKPVGSELERFQEFLKTQRSYHDAKAPAEAALAALTDAAHVFLNSNEFVYIN